MYYYRVLDDNERFADRWFLDEPLADSGEQIDAREFRYGRPYLGPLPARLPVHQDGREIQFNLAACDMPVVTEEIAQIVERMAPAEVECFRVKIGSSKSGCKPGYVILNAICQEACVDEQRSEVMRWKPEDGRPDKVGKYRMVSDLTVDPTRTHDRHIFRIEDFSVALIVSDDVKKALQGLRDLGIVFKPVC